MNYRSDLRSIAEMDLALTHSKSVVILFPVTAA